MKHVKLFESFVNEAKGDMKFHVLFPGIDGEGHRDIANGYSTKTAGKGKFIYIGYQTKEDILDMLYDVADGAYGTIKTVKLAQASSDFVDKKDFSKPLTFNKVGVWIDEQTPDKMYFFPKESVDYKRWFSSAVRSVANSKAGAFLDYKTSEEIAEDMADWFVDYIKNHPDYDISK